MKPSKALFIQLRRIGDLLMCTPAARAFKKTYPDCELDMLTEQPEVLKGNSNFNRIIAVDARKQFDPLYQFGLIRKIRNSKYDFVIDFLANPRSAYYAYLTGARTRLSYGYGHRRWAYNLVPPRPPVPLYSALDKLKLLEAINVKSDDPRLEYYPTDADREEAAKLLGEANDRPLVTISPVSRRIQRRWPLRNYAELGDLICEKLNARVMVLAGPGEEREADTVASSMAQKAEVPRILSLGVLGAIFEKTALHIGNDNGPKHIAVACGAPTFAIFGSQDPISWTFPDFLRHSWIEPKEFCEDCRQSRRHSEIECISKITVVSAWERICKMATSLPGFRTIPEKA